MNFPFIFGHRRNAGVRPVTILLAIIWITVAGGARAFEPLLDEAEALRAAAEVTVEKFPDADGVWVRSATRIHYQPDGTSEEWFDGFAKALTEKGRRDLRTFRFGYNRFYGDVEIRLIRLYKPDGRHQDVDIAGHSRTMIAPGQMQMNIYDPHQRLLQVAIPALEIGDTVRVVGRRRTVRTRMPDAWADYTTFEDTMPILEMWYEVHAPADRPLRHLRIRDEQPGTIAYEARETPGGIIHRWTARQVPRVFEEPNMPDLHTVVQRLLVSTIADWPTVSRWYWELSRPRLEAVSDPMREQVQALCAGLEDDEARLRAIFFHVAQNIRYMGLTTETVAPGYEPRDVRETFAARYGVCRDKAAVLVAMLRLAGFEAYPVLISVGPLMDADVPLPYFNHAIVAVRNGDGSFRLMDPTDETTSDLFPSYLGHRSYLVATPEGEPLRVSPVPTVEDNLMVIRTTASLSPHGELRGVTHLHFKGINDQAYRGHFLQLKAEERRRFFEGVLKRALPGAVLTGFTLEPEDLRVAAAPLTARLEYVVPDAWIAGRELVIPPVPAFGSLIGMVNFVLGRTGLDERRFPLVTEHRCGVSETWTLQLPPELSAPAAPLPSAEIPAPNFLWKRTLVADAAGRLSGETEWRMDTVEISPTEYRELKAALKRVAGEQRRRPLFRSARPPAAQKTPLTAPPSLPVTSADEEILEHTITYTVASEAEWERVETVRKRVLTQAGLRAAAEIKIPYNPVWEDVHLEFARVTSPTGESREISAHEINLMDAEWVGAAPRYPAGKIFVANLPSVGIGHLIEYGIRRRFRDRPFFHAFEPLAGHEPIAKRAVCLRFLNVVSLDVSNPDVATTETNRIEGDWTERVWVVSEVPPIPREDSQPPLWALAPTVLASAEGAAARYAAAVDAALREAMRSRAEVAAATRTLIQDAADRDARLRAIRDAVARRIRRAGPALHEVPLSCITPVDLTWREGYGHGADTAAVLAAMLETAGEQPEFVLVSAVRPAGPIAVTMRERFQPSFFPQVLVRIPYADAHLYLNDTDQYAPLGATPSEGRLALVLPQGRFEPVMVPTASRTATETDYRIEIGQTGDASLRVLRKYRGQAHAEEAKRYAEMTPEERRRHHQELVADIAQDAAASDELTSDFDRSPGTVSYTVRIPKYALREGDWLYHHLPRVSAGLPALRADARQTPLYWDRWIRERVRVTIVPPHADLRLEMTPPAMAWQSQAGAVRIETKVEGDVIEVHGETELAPAWFGPEDYPSLLDVHARLTHPRMRFLLFRYAVPRHSDSRDEAQVPHE